MRSILRSALLASFAATMTWFVSGCEDTAKTPETPPAAAPGEGKMEGKMEPKVEPAPAAPSTPAPGAPAEAPK